MKNTITIMAVFTLAFCLTGCAQKPTDPENIRSLAAIRTACSTKSLPLIENAKAQAQKDVTAGLVSPEFEEELSEVFACAEKGDWEKAIAKVSRLQRKYKPSKRGPPIHEHRHE